MDNMNYLESPERFKDRQAIDEFEEIHRAIDAKRTVDAEYASRVDLKSGRGIKRSLDVEPLGRDGDP